MTIDQLHTVYQAQPFRPFTLHLADGRSVYVHHQDFIMASPTGRTVNIYQQDDTLNIIDVLMITDIEFQPENENARKRDSA